MIDTSEMLKGEQSLIEKGLIEYVKKGSRIIDIRTTAKGLQVYEQIKREADEPDDATINGFLLFLEMVDGTPRQSGFPSLKDAIRRNKA
jgi:hypothetical protein